MGDKTEEVFLSELNKDYQDEKRDKKRNAKGQNRNFLSLSLKYFWQVSIYIFCGNIVLVFPISIFFAKQFCYSFYQHTTWQLATYLCGKLYVQDKWQQCLAFLVKASNYFVASSISHKMAILCRLFLANYFLMRQALTYLWEVASKIICNNIYLQMATIYFIAFNRNIFYTIPGSNMLPFFLKLFLPIESSQI